MGAAARHTADQINMQGLLAADAAKHGVKILHYSSYGLIAAAPIGVMGYFEKPIDIGLALALPAHTHVGINGIMTDYVPKISKSLLAPARVGMLGVTVLTTAGLLKLAMGPGICESVKSM